MFSSLFCGFCRFCSLVHGAVVLEVRWSSDILVRSILFLFFSFFWIIFCGIYIDFYGFFLILLFHADLISVLALLVVCAILSSIISV